MANVKKLAIDQPKTNHSEIPIGLKPYFKEYDFIDLDINNDANLIIARVQEYGTWEEARWLFGVYGAERVRSFIRQFGERGLNPVTFNYWRKLLKIRCWRRSPFPIPKGGLWNP